MSVESEECEVVEVGEEVSGEDVVMLYIQYVIQWNLQ